MIDAGFPEVFTAAITAQGEDDGVVIGRILQWNETMVSDLMRTRVHRSEKRSTCNETCGDIKSESSDCESFVSFTMISRGAGISFSVCN